ncbi:MAG: methyltransferase, partial [Planctomycetota bacterium]
TVEGIEFRSATVIAYKPDPGLWLDHHEAVIYRGPFSQVIDDEGNVFRRGVRSAVCRRSFELLTSDAYAEQFIGVTPKTEVSMQQAKPFDCDGEVLVRDPRITKGSILTLPQSTTGDEGCCGIEGCC